MSELEKNNELEKSQETMLERGIFEANGYKFDVHPIYLLEEKDYLSDVPYALYPQSDNEDGPDDKELSHYAMALFRYNGTSPKEVTSRWERIKEWLAKKFTHKYRYYSDNPNILGLVKWIEKKVYYKGRPIRFYDLERKFKLNKSEIVKLFGYFQDISGF